MGRRARYPLLAPEAEEVREEPGPDAKGRAAETRVKDRPFSSADCSEQYEGRRAEQPPERHERGDAAAAPGDVGVAAEEESVPARESERVEERHGGADSGG
jgi:hypothetical protein